MAEKQGTEPKKPANAQDAENAKQKKPYVVLTPLRHNLKHYAKGKTVMLTQKQADPLLERKVIALPTAAAPAAPEAAPATE